jgi:integrase
VAVATHKQALSALMFLYQKVLGVDLPWLAEIGRPKSRARLPVVLSHDEVSRVLMALDVEHRLLGQLLYGTGMRIMEGIRLRVKDVDFERQAVVEDHFRQFNTLALEVLCSPGPARTILLQYVSLHFDFISAHHRHASLYQQLIMGGGKPLERLVKKYFHPRTQALDQLLDRGIRAGDFRPADRIHTAISITSLIVFYFSASKVVQLLAHTDAYTPANLQHRKQEVLDFIRHAIFRDPAARLPAAPDPEAQPA